MHADTVGIYTHGACMAKKQKAKKETPPRLQKMDEKGQNKLSPAASSGEFKSRGGSKSGKGKGK